MVQRHAYHRSAIEACRHLSLVNHVVGILLRYAGARVGVVETPPVVIRHLQRLDAGGDGRVSSGVPGRRNRKNNAMNAVVATIMKTIIRLYDHNDSNMREAKSLFLVAPTLRCISVSTTFGRFPKHRAVLRGRLRGDARRLCRLRQSVG